MPFPPPHMIKKDKSLHDLMYIRKVPQITTIPYRSPPSENFGRFQGGGAAQNPDPSGACGGLFEKVNFTFHNTLKRIDCSKLQFVVNKLYW